MASGLQEVSSVDARGYHVNDYSTALNCNVWNFSQGEPRSGFGDDSKHVDNATTRDSFS
jgi:hypothetical protein